jgi:hypothetical protein
MVEQVLVVHGGQRRVIVRGGRHHRRARRGERVPQHHRAPRHLGARLPHPEPHLTARIMAQAVLAPHDRHLRDHEFHT